MADVSLRSALRQVDRLFSEGAVGGLSDAQLLERFADRRDEAAFGVLLERHGPMVLAVCQGVLRDPTEAEDAFQATFLVLVRKAGSVWVGDSLGGWLHRVAYRVALQLSVDAARRRARQGGDVHDLALDRSRPDASDDLRPLLHAELARLPEKYRLPLVLCHLEGLSQPQVAARLRYSEATLRRRLARGRDLLRARLVRRGIAPTVGILAVLEATSARAVSCVLTAATLRSVSAFLAGGAIEGSVTALAGGVLRKMGLARLRALTLAIGSLGASILLAAGVVARDEPEPTPRPTARVSPAPDPSLAGPLVYSGRVLDPLGKPVAAARVHLTGKTSRNSPDVPPLRTSTAADGAYHFEVPRSDFEMTYYDEPWTANGVAAIVPGFGLGIGRNTRPGQTSTLRLAEDLPIVGRVIDLQGRPIAGVTIRPFAIRGTESGDLSPLLLRYTDPEAAHGSRVVDQVYEGINGLIPAVVTGDDGRFTLAGLGRERLVLAKVEGPTIAVDTLHIMTRRAPAVAASEGSRKFSILGAEFDYIAAPSHPIEGVVRDLDTSRPLAGMTIYGYDTPWGFGNNWVRDVTDQEGRFRLTGLPAGREVSLAADPPDGEPYLHGSRRVSNSVDARPTEVTLEMKRGVWIEGRVTELTTGRPVRGQVSYKAFVDNPQTSVYRRTGDDSNHNLRYTAPDGSYRLIGLPGPGLVAFRANNDDGYARGRLGEGTRRPQEGDYFRTRPGGFVILSNFHALAEVNPAADTTLAHRDLQVDPGRTLKVAVVGPDGQPLSGSQVINREYRWRLDPVADTSFEVIRLLKGHERTLTILHDGRKLAGGLTLQGDEVGPITVRLEPWAVATGQLVDEEGEPLTGVYVGGVDRPRYDPAGGVSGTVPVDEQGRFRAEGLVPGRKYRLYSGRGNYVFGTLVEELVLAPGEERDLGRMTVREGR